MKMKFYLLLTLGFWGALTSFAQTDEITNAFNDLQRQGGAIANSNDDYMSIKASEEQLSQLLLQKPESGYFLFIDNRYNSLRSAEFVPERWAKMSETRRNNLYDRGNPGEFYPFQLGIYAATSNLEAVEVEFSDFKSTTGGKISASEFRCFNSGGVDIYGKYNKYVISVGKERVQALWMGVQLPESATGVYSGFITIKPKGLQPMVAQLSIEISGDKVANNGDNEGWRLSRLRWLDSKVGAATAPTAPYIPISVTGNSISYLGARVDIGQSGMPLAVSTFYNSAVKLDENIENRLLKSAMRFVIETPSGEEVLKSKGVSLKKLSDGRAQWSAKSSNSNFEVETSGVIEFDGWSNVSFKVRAKNDLEVKDIRFEAPYMQTAATYFMGLGHKGGYRSADSILWQWNVEKHQDEFWMGDVNVGMRMKFTDENYRRPLVNIYYSLGKLNMPTSWGNGGRGGICISQADSSSAVNVVAYSGQRQMVKGQELCYNVDMLITPVKPIDLAVHFNERFYHSNSDVSSDYILEAKKGGANQTNIHHKKDIYPFINYPYYDDALADLKQFVDKAHSNNIKVRLYYTTRELTVKIPEIWALRSLGGEVIFDGPGRNARTLIHSKGPNKWLVDNFSTNFIPAWYNAFESGKYKGDMDISVITTPDSRWNNYYLQGLDWMVKNIGVDGVYIDDSALDRETIKRARRVLDSDGMRRNIDLHSWNHNNEYAGFANSLLMYSDLFPYVDHLWIGEGFELTNTPDFWLVEMSGIPFGLMSETLEARNYWRGMVFGMTPRLPWSGDPTPMWKLIDDLDLGKSEMVGFWNENLPVACSHPDVKATVYKLDGKALIVLANWSDTFVSCKLTIDSSLLGFEPSKLSMPYINKTQWEGSVNLKREIPLNGRMGAFILVE